LKSIYTLVADIQHLLKDRGWCNEQLAKAIASGAADRLQRNFMGGEKKATLRLSAMGPRCPKALWYSIHHPERAEQLPPWANFKYSFGHIIEAMAIELAKETGHNVEGEQDELELDGVIGHRDCVIDGCTVDVKSASSYSFKEFERGTFVDLFGYLDQLDGYVLAAKDDPLVTVKDRGFDLVIDKQLGHMYLHEHKVTHEREKVLRERIGRYKSIVVRPDPPACTCATTTDTIGNTKLDTRASYSPWKYCCFPELRTFLYSSGPTYCTHVTKRPYNKNGPIVEVDRLGNII
jgi:hypothetical protein